MRPVDHSDLPRVPQGLCMVVPSRLCSLQQPPILKLLHRPCWGFVIPTDVRQQGSYRLVLARMHPQTELRDGTHQECTRTNVEIVQVHPPKVYSALSVFLSDRSLRRRLSCWHA